MPVEITIYTDGAARGNPGPGGYGVVLISGEHRKELSGGFRRTTNNRMELLAVIKGLEALKIPGSKVTIYTDSRYVADAVNKGWVFRWERTGFKNKKNPDLWKRFPPTELDSIWFAENNTDKLYFGHLFLLGVQHLQSLMTFSGFSIRQRIKTDWGTTSVILGVIVYPLMAMATCFSYLVYKNKNTHVEETVRKKILRERMKLNLSPTTLFRKHIFWEAEKVGSKNETVEKLKKMHRI